MEHKNFIICSVVQLIIILIDMGLYSYFKLVHSDIQIAIYVLKCVPLTVLLTGGLLYNLLYHSHNYSILVTLSFGFSLIGDIMLMLPDHPIENSLIKIDNIYFILGGISFGITRILLIFSLIMKPYQTSNRTSGGFLTKFIQFRNLGITLGYVIISNIAPLLNLLAGVLLLFYLPTIFLRVSLLFYFLLMTLQFVFTMIRFKYTDESFESRCLQLFAVLFFNFADILMFYNIYVLEFYLNGSNIVHLISINFYWISMILLGWSLVRNWKSELQEKTGCYIQYSYINT